MIGTRRPASLVAVALLALATGACGGAEAQTVDTLGGIGKIPGHSSLSEVTLPPNLARNVDFPDLLGVVVGTVAKGNRVLLIGDSIFASTASRYGGEMCKALVPAGWRVAVEAEAGRFVTFGKKVVTQRLGEGWDAVVIFLGNNYTGGAENYKRDLGWILDEVDPRPTVLVTTSLFREKQKEVNAAILELAAARTNITVLDWAAIAVQPGVLAGDRIHPSSDGVKILARSVGRALGTAPKGSGSCLASLFTDDSSVDEKVMPSTTVAGAPATTVPPATSTPETSSSVAG